MDNVDRMVGVHSEDGSFSFMCAHFGVVLQIKMVDMVAFFMFG
jgi:hypothetical protein